MMTIFYEIDKKLYVNITNKCPCKCEFCVRNKGDSVLGSDTLWLDHEPDLEEIKESFKKFENRAYEEIVFCGYGEPTERLNDLLILAKFFKIKCKSKIRVNTNGLSDLINKRKTAPEFKGIVDIISISLNADESYKYFERCRPKYGKNSYDAIIEFSKDIKKYVPIVIFSVVDMISKQELENCRKISENMGINFRVRTHV